VRGLLTRDERAVIAFLTAAVAVGAIVLGLTRVDPSRMPDLGPAAENDREVSSAASGTGEGIGSLNPGHPIDVNGAGVEELTRLPGIGPSKAAAIVVYRDTHGSFETLDELLDVSGIGPATLARLRPMATVDARRTAHGAQAREVR